jgi:hypothetical protein
MPFQMIVWGTTQLPYGWASRRHFRRRLGLTPATTMSIRRSWGYIITAFANGVCHFRRRWQRLSELDSVFNVKYIVLQKFGRSNYFWKKITYLLQQDFKRSIFSMTLRPGDLDLHVLSYSIHAPCKTANGMRTSPKSNQIIHALEVIKLVGVCHIGLWTSRVHFETPKLFKCVTRCPKHLWLLLTAYVDPTWIRRAPLGAERPYFHAQSTFWI